MAKKKKENPFMRHLAAVVRTSERLKAAWPDMLRKAVGDAQEWYWTNVAWRKFTPEAYERFGLAFRGRKYDESKRNARRLKAEGVEYPNPQFGCSRPAPFVRTGRLLAFMMGVQHPAAGINPSIVKLYRARSEALAVISGRGSNRTVKMRSEWTYNHPLRPEHAAEMRKVTANDYRGMVRVFHNSLYEQAKLMGVVFSGRRQARRVIA